MMSSTGWHHLAVGRKDCGVQIPSPLLPAGLAVCCKLNGLSYCTRMGTMLPEEEHQMLRAAVIMLHVQPHSACRHCRRSCRPAADAPSASTKSRECPAGQQLSQAVGARAVGCWSQTGHCDGSVERHLGHLSQHLAAPLNLLLAGTGRLGGTDTKRVSITHTAGGAPHMAHRLLASAN